MTPELMAIFGTGIALAGLILSTNRGLSDRVARVEHSQAKLEGLLEGLREAITGRARVP